MLVPNFQPSEHSKKSAPKWMDVDAINKNVNAEKKGIEDQIQKSAGLVQSHLEHVISYSCSKCSKTFNVDDRRLVAQANLMNAHLQTEGDWRCPDCKAQLNPYETRPILNKIDNRYGELQEKRSDLEVEASYNTTVDRLLMNKTLDALAKHANKSGMTLPVVNYLKANRTTNASDNTLESFNSIDCEVKWRYGRNQLARVEATVGIDQAGNFELPRVFKFAGQEFPFEKKYIQQVEKEIRQKDLSRGPRKSDWLNVKKPDPTRFRGATASLQTEANTPLVAPTAPIANNQPQQYQPNQQVVNPADGKTYSVVNHDQNTGMTVVDPMTQQQSIIPKDQVMNVKPAVQTAQASLIDELVDVELKKKAFSVTAIIDELAGGIDLPKDSLHEDVGVLNPSMVCPQCKNKGMKFIIEDDALGNEEGFQCPKCGHYANKHDLNPPIDPSYARAATSKRPDIVAVGKKWAERRKELQEEREANQKLASTPVSRKSFQDQVVEKFTKEAYKGFKPLSTEPTESGRTDNGVPVGESGEVEIGMTDFPDYTKPFQEAQQEMVDAREHFPQEDMLPMRHLPINRLKEFVDGKKDEKNYGLSNTKGEEFENPKLQFEAAEIAKEIAKTAMESGELPDGSGFATMTVDTDKDTKKEAAGILPGSPFPDNLMDAQVNDVDAYLDEKASTGSIRGNGWSMINEVASKFPNVDKGTIKQRMIEKGLINKLASDPKKKVATLLKTANFESLKAGVIKYLQNYATKYPGEGAEEILEKVKPVNDSASIAYALYDWYGDWEEVVDAIVMVVDGKFDANYGEQVNLGENSDDTDPIAPDMKKELYRQDQRDKGGLDPLSHDTTASLKTAAEEAIDKAIDEKVVPVVEKPVVYKETKTAPKLEGITEPAVIEQAEGKGKEAITKLRIAQKELAALQEEMALKLKPFQESLAEKSKEYAGPMKTKIDAVTTYVNMAFDQLSLLETSTVAYEQEIYAAIQRSKAEAGKASYPEILKKAEEIAPQIAEEIKKIQAMIENDRTTEVIEKFLYNYPQSKSHEKKVKTSSHESVEIDSLIKEWVEVVKALLTLNTLMIA